MLEQNLIFRQTHQNLHRKMWLWSNRIIYCSPCEFSNIVLNHITFQNGYRSSSKGDSCVDGLGSETKPQLAPADNKFLLGKHVKTCLVLYTFVVLPQPEEKNVFPLRPNMNLLVAERVSVYFPPLFWRKQRKQLKAFRSFVANGLPALTLSRTGRLLNR